MNPSSNEPLEILPDHQQIIRLKGLYGPQLKVLKDRGISFSDLFERAGLDRQLEKERSHISWAEFTRLEEAYDEAVGSTPEAVEEAYRKCFTSSKGYSFAQSVGRLLGPHFMARTGSEWFMPRFFPMISSQYKYISECCYEVAFEVDSAYSPNPHFLRHLELSGSLLPEMLGLQSQHTILFNSEHGRRIQIKFKKPTGIISRGLAWMFLRLGGDAFYRTLLSQANELKVANQNLRELNDSLEAAVKNRTSEIEFLVRREASEAKKESMAFLTAGLAHEINNPLAIIHAKAFTIPRHSDNDNKIKSDAATILKAALRIDQVLRRIREATASSSNSKHHTDVQSVKSGLEERYTQELGGNPTLRIDDHSNGHKIAINSTDMIRALWEILHNAHTHHTGDGPIRVIIRSDQNFCRFTVENEGAGFTDGMQEKASEPFVTTGLAQKRFGLGLSIAKNTLETFEGQLTIEQGNPTRVSALIPHWIEEMSKKESA